VFFSIMGSDGIATDIIVGVVTGHLCTCRAAVHPFFPMPRSRARCLYDNERCCGTADVNGKLNRFKPDQAKLESWESGCLSHFASQPVLSRVPLPCARAGPWR
jgi:hypothetical protein